jgi:hypothetical protein
MNRRILEHRAGTLMVSADLHGNLEDFLRLESLFEEALAAGEDRIWVGLGDWVHGPHPARKKSTLGWAGEELYGYPDESVALLERLAALEARHPGRFFSLLGNHEHAHLGGKKVQKYHPDEAAFLEDALGPEGRARFLAMLDRWSLVIQVPSCGIVLTHGAPPDEIEDGAQIDAMDRRGGKESFVDDLLWSYGFGPRGGRNFLDRIAGPGERYDLIVHGHDRELDGGATSGAHGYLLCTSFGARRAKKAYLLLDLTRRYRSAADLREGIEIRRLYAAA